MGELADDVADAFRDNGGYTGYRRGLTETHQDLVDRIADLEQRCAMMEAAASMASATFTGTAAPLTNATRAVPDDVLDRLADAEQRAAAAWAAVTSVVVRHMRVMDVVEVQPDADGNAFMTGLGTYSQIGGVNKRILLAVLLPSSPANPDLLERASVELAEAYQRAKAEEQRQAEQAADAKENAVFRATPKDPDADAVTFTMRMTP